MFAAVEQVTSSPTFSRAIKWLFKHKISVSTVGALMLFILQQMQHDSSSHEIASSAKQFFSIVAPILFAVQAHKWSRENQLVCA
jgi:hypothetical protein